jgi:Helix-turn-helix domain
MAKKKIIKNSEKKVKNEQKSKLDCVKEFTDKWMAYEKVTSDWILTVDRLGLSSISCYEWLTDDTAFHRFEDALKKHNVKRPDLPTLHQELTDTALPILEFLFGPNEVPLIPELPTWCQGGWDEWHEKKQPIGHDMINRIMGARNKIRASELKTKAKIIPRSGWSSPYPITHWAKVFNISRKTMQNWLENNQIIARKIGSKWRIAIEELPATDDQDASQ